MYNRPCNTEWDCGQTAFLKCKFKGIRKECVHKDIFPIHEGELFGTLGLTMIMAMAVVAGIGGGGIIVSLFMEFY